MEESKTLDEESLGKKNRRDTLIVIGVALALIAAGFLASKLLDPGYSREPYRRMEYVLDDYVTISAYGKDRAQVEEAVAAAFDELYRIQDIADRYREGSELSRLNATASSGPVAVSDDLWAMIETGREVYESSKGLFDITLGPLIDVWDVVGRAGSGEPPPGEEEIAQAMRLVGMDKLVLDEKERSVYMTQPGMALDLGGLAKGYAVDRAAEALRERGIEAAVVDMISTSLVLGEKPGGKGPRWSIEVMNPRVQESPLAELSLPSGLYISTSGDYQRYFEYGGVRYHHILDPRTGYPARGTMSVTVIGGRDGAWADAMSTAAFVMGYPEGAQWVRDEGAEAMLVDSDGKVYTTPGMDTWLVSREESVPAP